MLPVAGGSSSSDRNAGTHDRDDPVQRELAYVALSRARHHTRIHVTADSPDDAVDLLADDWVGERNQQWITGRRSSVEVELREDTVALLARLDQMGLSGPDVDLPEIV